MHCPRWPVSRWASKSPPPAHPPARPVCASVSAPTRSFAKLEHFEQSISNHRPHDGVPRLIRDIRWWTRDRLHQVAATDQASPWGRGVRTGCWEGRGSQGSDPVRHGRKASVVCVGATVMIGRGEQTGCIGMYGGWAYDGWTYGDGRVAAGRVAMGAWRWAHAAWVGCDDHRCGICDMACALWHDCDIDRKNAYGYCMAYATPPNYMCGLGKHSRWAWMPVAAVYTLLPLVSVHCAEIRLQSTQSQLTE